MFDLLSARVTEEAMKVAETMMKNIYSPCSSHRSWDISNVVEYKECTEEMIKRSTQIVSIKSEIEQVANGYQNSNIEKRNNKNQNYLSSL